MIHYGFNTNTTENRRLLVLMIRHSSQTDIFRDVTRHNLANRKLPTF